MEKEPLCEIIKLLSKRSRPIILLLGNYGEGNVGDEAILRVLVDALQREGIRIKVPSRRPEILRSLHRNLKGFEPLSILGALTVNPDIIVVGGGGLFGKFHGSFLYFALLYVLFARLILKKPLVIYSVGVGSLSSPLREFVKIIMSHATHVSVRDRTSLMNVHRIGVHKKVEIISDPVLRMKPPDKRKKNFAKEMLKRKSIRDNREKIRLVGIVLNGHEIIKNHKEFEIAEIIKRLVSHGFKVCFFTFNPSFTRATSYTDPVCIKRIEEILSHDRKLGLRLRRRLKLFDYFPPEVTQALLDEMDMLIPMRYHSIIFAHSLRKPFVAISYDERCEEFLESINHEDYVRLKDLTAELFMEKFLRRLLQHQESRKATNG